MNNIKLSISTLTLAWSMIADALTYEAQYITKGHDTIFSLVLDVYRDTDIDIQGKPIDVTKHTLERGYRIYREASFYTKKSVEDTRTQIESIEEA